MALFSRIKNWVAGEVLTASDLNTEFNNLLNNTSADKITGASGSLAEFQATIDPGDVGSESLPVDVKGEILRLRNEIKAIKNTPQWYSNLTPTLQAAIPADNSVSTIKIQDSAVTTAKIANDAVTTPKILNGAVTPLKVADLVYSSGAGSEFNGGYSISCASTTNSYQVLGAAITLGSLANCKNVEIQLIAGNDNQTGPRTNFVTNYNTAFSIAGNVIRVNAGTGATNYNFKGHLVLLTNDEVTVLDSVSIGPRVGNAETAPYNVVNFAYPLNAVPPLRYYNNAGLPTTFKVALVSSCVSNGTGTSYSVGLLDIKFRIKAW